MSKGNFKVRCVETERGWLTAGKIYEIKDGKMIDDEGELYPLGSRTLDGIEDVRQYYSSSKWELVDDTIQTITIRQKGRKVIAVLNDAYGNYINSAKAICSPEDTFDFEIGKNIAIKRLLGEEVKNITLTLDGKKISQAVKRQGEALASIRKSSFDWKTFKSGKFAVHCDTEEKAKAFLKECDEHGLRWCAGEKATDYVGWNNQYQCYDAEYGELSHEEMTWYKDRGYPVIDYTPSKPAVKEVKRPAKVGEWIKVVESDCHKYGCYEPGDIIYVTKEYEPNLVVEGYNRGTTCRLVEREYVVLENYDYSLGFPKNEPFRKAKVGDKIKVVRDDGNHYPSPTIGEIHEVTSFSNSIPGVWTNKNNVFWDTDQEYIIIEEAPEVKSDTIEIGDTVRVVGSLRTCDTYLKFIETNAKDFISKYENGYCPTNGDTGIVVGQGKHERYAGNYYVVLSKGKAFCIGEKGIDKV